MRNPVQIASGLYRFEKVLPSGWGLNMLVLTLPSGGLLVHSPTWLGEGTWAAIEKLGMPRILFAPNHFHHASLRRFRDRYTGAISVASAGARPRLERKGHEDVRDLDEALALLPEGCRILPCEGTKSGEAWLLVPGEGGPTLIVCDAFFNVARPVRGIQGSLLRALKIIPGLSIGQTFPWLALKDRAAYARWAVGVFERERPLRLVPSHGEPVYDPALAERLSMLVRARID